MSDGISSIFAFLPNCEELLHCKSFLHFVQQKFIAYLILCVIEDFLTLLTVGFVQYALKKWPRDITLV